MTRNILFTFLSMFLIHTGGIAQANPRYLVLFKDKNGSPYTVQNPSDYLSERAVERRSRQNIPVTSNDFPVNPTYTAALKQTGATLIYSSRWFNGSLVEASDVQLAAIKLLPFYKGIELNLPVANINTPTTGIERISGINTKLGTTEELNYGSMNRQLALLDVPPFHQKGYQGENMLIAVLDDGFAKGKEVGFLKHLYEENRIQDTHDFVGRDGDVYNDGSHGLHVLSTMAAYEPGTMIGVSFKARYALYRTENDFAETPYEEITWLMAAERADSIGADVINSSLGYYSFDDEFNTSAYNYTYADMDGKTTIISRAARFATRTGLLVVVSAGNEGNNTWKYITAPADVDSVLAVGAANYDRSYAPLSSIGPNAVGQLKPDVAAVGSGTVIGNGNGTVSSGSGTSFSSPQIAGLCAILWQAYPDLTAQQLIASLKSSGSQAASPDQLLGYGVPSALRAEELIQKTYLILGVEKNLIQSVVLSPNPAHDKVILTIPQALIGKKSTLNLLLPSGALVQRSQLILTTKIDVATDTLAPGLYFLQIKVADQERTMKFIKY